MTVLAVRPMVTLVAPETGLAEKREKAGQLPSISWKREPEHEGGRRVWGGALESTSWWCGDSP